MSAPIFHLAMPTDWAGAITEYSAPSLETEGFIHCSTAAQLDDVARNFYIDRNDLILLAIDPEPLGDSLVFEDLPGTGMEYPHVYKPIPTTAVHSTGPYLAHLEEGLWLDNRFDREWMERMLHPEFEEVAGSGRRYSREEILESAPEGIVVELPHEGYRLELIDEDVALARYLSRASYEGGDHPAERVSVWVNTNEGWRIRYHQGTPLP